MTDEEAIAWLSRDEVDHWMNASSFEGTLYVEDILLSLAETRNALAACESKAVIDGCDLCGEYNEPARHSPTCIFTTMPRPR